VRLLSQLASPEAMDKNWQKEDNERLMVVAALQKHFGGWWDCHSSITAETPLSF